MPLFFIHDFYFVRKKGTEIHIAVDGRSHKPDGFPMPMDGAWIYFTRYSAAPLIVSWNESYRGPLEAHWPVNALHQAGDTEYQLVHRAEHVEIAAMRAGYGPRSVTVRFKPAVPDVPALREGVSVEGRFEVVSHPPAGSVGGVYRIARQGDQVLLQATTCPHEPQSRGPSSGSLRDVADDSIHLGERGALRLFQE